MPKNITKTNKTTATSDTPPRKRKLAEPKHRSFRLEKHFPRAPRPAIAGSFLLFRRAFGILKQNWKLFLGITAVYALLNLLLVQNFFGIDVSAAKDSAQSFLHGHWGKVANGFSVIGYLFGSAGTSPSTSAYRLILAIIGSLAMIWALRQVLAGTPRVRIRDSFYEGMYPLVPFILIFLVISLQLIPITIALYLYGVVGASGLMEASLWALVIGALAVLTLYMVSSSIFALYVACLPGMTPVASLKAAADLVRHRRLAVVSRLIMLPIMLIVLLAVVMIPLIIFATPAVTIVFFLFLMVALPVIHSYFYCLYRELLNE